MGDIIAMLRSDHHQLDEVFTSVESGHVVAIPDMCRLLNSHSVIEEQVFYPHMVRRLDERGEVVIDALHDHHEMRQLVAELEDALDVTEDYVATASRVIRMAREHMTAEEESLLAVAEEVLTDEERSGLADEAQRLRSASDADELGATSDGDGSWTDAPLTQDPTEDRSIEAAMRRSS